MFSQKLWNCVVVKGNVIFCARHAHGNKKYLAKRFRRSKARNLFAPVENLHAVRRGEKYAVRYTDKYGVRSDKFVPMQKIAAPRFTWDYDLTEENVDFMKSITLESSKELTGNSPFVDEQWPIHSWIPGSRRCGAVGIKLGVHPVWFKDGTYCNATLLQILECNVIKYFSKEEYNNRSAAILVGGKNTSPFYKNEAYDRFCLEAGVPVKARCFRFTISENAALKPGTPLTAMHFRPGQYVDCTAKSIGYGFQGVIQRWEFAGGPHNAKLNHRRPGAIGPRTGNIMKGKRMEGQLGGTYETTRGLKVLRVNTRYNVIYVKGRIAGHINQFVKICDSTVGRYQPRNEEEALKLIGPFPRYLPKDEHETLPDEIYDSTVFPSLINRDSLGRFCAMKREIPAGIGEKRTVFSGFLHLSTNR